MKPDAPVCDDYVQHYQRLRADVHDRHAVGMVYHIGYLRGRQAQLVLHGNWHAWVALYTIHELEALGIPSASQLLDEQSPNAQVHAIVGAILGELEAQVFQLLEKPEGLATAGQWLAALLDSPPAGFVGSRHKADLEALRSVVLWQAREISEVSAVVQSFADGNSAAERGPFSFWLMHRSTGQRLLQEAKVGALTRSRELACHEQTEKLLQELHEELLPELKPDALTSSVLDRISNWHASAVAVPTGQGPGRQALQTAIGKTLVPKLNEVVEAALTERMQRACKEAMRALQHGGFITETEVYNPTTCSGPAGGGGAESGAGPVRG